jgi:hypothetical protein
LSHQKNLHFWGVREEVTADHTRIAKQHLLAPDFFRVKLTFRLQNFLHVLYREGRESPPRMSRCPFGVFPNYSLRGVPVPVFGQPDRPYIAIPSAVHDELFARMAQPLDITAKRHTPPFGRPAIPWPGKVAEMEDWTKREGFGKSPRYLADKLGSSGAFSQAGYSTCSAVGMLETLDLINLPPSCASP